MSVMFKFMTAVRLLETGSKLLQRCCSSNAPSQIAGEGFRWDVKSTPTKLMTQVTDFVDANGYFVHPELPWHTRFTADYEKSVRLNKDRGSKDVFAYWPESCMYHIDHKLVDQLESEFAKWPATSGMKDNVLDWGIGIARVYSVFPEVPWNRLCFNHKRFVETFFTDDSFEESCRTGTAASFGAAFLANCGMVVLNRPGIIDLRAFESDRVKRKLIEDSLFAMEVLQMTTDLARQTLTPLMFKHFQDSSLLYHEYVLKESVNFYKHMNEKQFIDYEVLLETRTHSVGFEIVLSGVLEQDGSIHDRMVGTFNPIVHVLSAVVSMDNDHMSSAKETGTADGKDICPINFYSSISKEHNDPMDAVRATLLLRNSMLHNVEQQVKMLPKTWRKSYENVIKLTCSIADYGYLLGHGRPNPRYGCVWKDY